MTENIAQKDNRYDPSDYLNKTESAVRYLFDALSRYNDLLRRGILPGPGVPHDHPEFDEIMTAWREGNRQQIDAAISAQREYSAERFAKATICTAILNVADKGIETCSSSSSVPPGWGSIIRPQVARYCVGRLVRDVPAGLIVYAGRNQASHYDDNLRQPSREIFDRMALNHGVSGFSGQKSPDFDLGRHAGENMASSIVALLGWRNYDDYLQDMKIMLGFL